MYSAFQLELTDEILDMIEQQGTEALNAESYAPYSVNFEEDNDSTAINKELNNLISINGHLDASRMQKNWFPKIKSHVFISHSHKDEEKAKTIADWLFWKFGLTSFIDSTVWGYSEELLRKIDNEFCLNESTELYDYNKRNKSTAHVHMILMSALAKMIDNTECLLFLNTPESTNSRDAIEGDTTYSPWIFSELMLSSLIRRRSINDHRPKLAMDSVSMEEYKTLIVEYPVPLNHLIDLNSIDIKKWVDKSKNNTSLQNLDLLYEIKEDEIINYRKIL